MKKKDKDKREKYLNNYRVSDPEGSKKENKMTETQRAMLEAKIMQVPLGGVGNMYHND